MKRVLAVGLFALSSVALVGCGSDGPSNTMEGVDAAAVQSYDEMVAADEAAMDASGDTGDATEGAAAAE